MRADQFMRLAQRALPELVRRYHLAEWWIDVSLADPEEMSHPDHVAEVRIDEPYRRAEILVSREALKGWDQAKAMTVLEHEVQHITGWWLEDLRALVMAALEDAEDSTRRMVERSFHRAHELFRGVLGRLLKAGNNFAQDGE
jgi:hypothetical protein